MKTAVAGVGVQLVGGSASAGSRGGVAAFPFMSTSSREPNTGDGTNTGNPTTYKLIFYKISNEATGTDTISNLTLFFMVFGTNRSRLLQVSLSNSIRFIRADTATTTCTPTVVPGNTIALPKVSVSALAANGQKAGWTPFSIRLDNCKTNGVQSNGTNVRTFFDGPRVNATTGNLDVTGAANVQLQLSNGDGSVINLAGAKGSQNVATTQISAGTAILPYAASYFATGKAGAGTVSSTVNFTIEFP
jgi:major type 1 subunit fimbrin (pilin)